MVYDWSPHEATIRRLYVEDKLPLERIRSHMREHHQFKPSKRAFQRQFAVWNFPPKYSPVHHDAALVARVRELWERNLGQREMLRALVDEGFVVTERELSRVRVKNRWLLRIRKGNKKQQPSAAAAARDGDDGAGERGDDDPGEETTPPGTPDANAAEDDDDDDDDDAAAASPERPEPQPKPPSGRALRRRRSSSPDKPVRFPSEMTLDEARRALGLDGATYWELRTAFGAACERAGILKKTAAGPGPWEAAKRAALDETPTLRAVLRGGGGGPGEEAALAHRQLALEIICSDVTKRMRMQGRRMTVQQAKKTLGLNPAEIREAQAAMKRLLRQEGVESKTSAGAEQWERVKRRWLAGSALMRRAVGAGAGQEGEKGRALEVMAKDVLKRLRVEDARARPDSQRPTASSRSRAAAPKPAPGTTTTSRFVPVDDPFGYGSPPPQMQVSPPSSSTVRGQSALQFGPSQMAPPAGASAGQQFARQFGTVAPVGGEFGQVHQQASPRSATLRRGQRREREQQQQQQQQQQHQQQHWQQPLGPPPAATPQASSRALAAYIRLDPSSTFVPGTTKLWVAMLTSRSVQDLRRVAAEKWAGAGVTCVRVEGVVRDGEGGEVPLLIGDDHELAAYLDVQGQGPTFNVQLVVG